MLQKLEILDEALNKLDQINNKNFLFKKFKEVNSQIESILVDIKSNELDIETNQEVLDTLRKL